MLKCLHQCHQELIHPSHKGSSPLAASKFSRKTASESCLSKTYLFQSQVQTIDQRVQLPKRLSDHLQLLRYRWCSLRTVLHNAIRLLLVHLAQLVRLPLKVKGLSYTKCESKSINDDYYVMMCLRSCCFSFQ